MHLSTRGLIFVLLGLIAGTLLIQGSGGPAADYLAGFAQ